MSLSVCYVWKIERVDVELPSACTTPDFTLPLLRLSLVIIVTDID